MRTTIKWAKEPEAVYVPQVFHDHQLLQVHGDAEKEFYDWVLEQNFPVHVFRTVVGSEGASGSATTTVAFSPVAWASKVPKIDAAMMMIKMTWSSRPDVDWQAKGYTKCKVFQK